MAHGGNWRETMVEIRIYVEGGGEQINTKSRLQQGMSKFLERLTGIRIKCIVCGTRNHAYRDFKNALKSHPDAINLLLVDSEDFVKPSHPELNPKPHLINRDQWDLSGIDENRIHLMVQSMESWLIADADTLAKYYRQGFKKKAIPPNNNVEEIPKDRVTSILQRATANTQKGEYHKIRHGPEILEMLDTSIVRRKAPYCDRLFQTIQDLVQEPDT